MKPIYEDLLHFDRPFYEIHEDNYHPVKAITNFWDNYSLTAIREYLYALDLKCQTLGSVVKNKPEAAKQTLFLADILRALMAYFLTHSHNIDIREIKLSKLEENLEEIQLTKKNNDFFQSINNTNT